MSHYLYIDNKGVETIISSGTNTMLVREGLEFVRELTEKEHQARFNHIVEENGKKPPPRNLLQEIDELKKELASVKANAHKPEQP